MGDIDYTALEHQYAQLRTIVLVDLAERLEKHLRHFVGNDRIDRITCRAKEVASFVEKAKKIDERGHRKYDEPLRQIQDQVGARIVTFFRADVPRIQGLVLQAYRGIETQLFIPDAPNKFEYEAVHQILAIPPEIAPSDFPSDQTPQFFELQIKTLFQHAWAQAEHDITYKPDYPWTDEHKRKIAFTAAQSWGADLIFDELFREQEAHKNGAN